MLALGTGATLAGCARARVPRQLTMWAMGTLGENLPPLLVPFQRATGITVDLQSIAWTNAHEKLLTGFAGDSLPDVMMVNIYWLSELALLGAFAPLPSHPPLLADQFPGALASVTIGGRAVAVPFVADSWAQYYRRDLLAEVDHDAPPLDWAGWSAMARAILRRHPDRHATFHPLDWPEPLFNLAAEQPDPLLRDRNARGNFSTPGFRAALAFYKSIYDERWSPAITYAQAGDAYLNFRRGWYAILPSDAITIGDLRRRTDLIPPALWGATRTPGPRGAGAAMARGAGLTVSHRARDADQAWRLVSYLAGVSVQRRIYGVTGDLPTRPSAWTGAELANDKVAGVFAEQIAASVAQPAVPEWERIQTEVQQVAEHMVRGEYSIDAATREMDRRVDRILEKRRWLLDRGRIA